MTGLVTQTAIRYETVSVRYHCRNAKSKESSERLIAWEFFEFALNVVVEVQVMRMLYTHQLLDTHSDNYRASTTSKGRTMKSETML